MRKIISPTTRLVSILFATSLGLVSDLFAGAEIQLSGNRSTSVLLYVEDLGALRRQAIELEDETILKRACEIQRDRSLPPVSCFEFAKSTTETQELTEECERLAHRAFVLPALNRLVPEACRQAIESRKLDLKYVQSGG